MRRLNTLIGFFSTFIVLFSTLPQTYGQIGFRPSTREGFTIHVSEAHPTHFVPIRNAQLFLVMNADTVQLKTDRNGEAFYRGPYKSSFLKIIASHPDFNTAIDSIAAPKTLQSVAGIQLRMKSKR